MKSPRKSPSVGRNEGSNGPSKEETLQALATEILDQEMMATVRERRKSHRKAYEGKGGTLPELDLLYKKRDDTPGEIEAFFRRQWSTLTAFFSDLSDQMDLFTPKATRERKAAFGHAGLMAGIKGEDGTPPPNLEGDELNEYMEAFHRGNDARVRSATEQLEILQNALKTAAEGGVVDGTVGSVGGPVEEKRGRGRPKKAVEVADKAAADFAADNPGVKIVGDSFVPPDGDKPGEIVDNDPLGIGDDDGTEALGIATGDGKLTGGVLKRTTPPNWQHFSDDPEEWFADQKRVFGEWYDGLEDASQVAVDHPGAAAAMDARQKAAEFEAPESEIAAQAGRKVAEPADDSLTVDGQLYPSKRAANAARKVMSQSEKAEAKRAAAGL